jgi:peptidyl-prolyl cis-trans isomerase SurA
MGKRNELRQVMMIQPALSQLAKWMAAAKYAIFALLMGVFASVTPLNAQSDLFSPVMIVNDRSISGYELQQRTLFLQILRQPGDIEAEALKSLIEDRLRMALAKQVGLVVAPDALQAGMEEFAGRANLTAEEFLKAVGQAGIDPETFRDFVEAGLAWRDIVRGKFAPTVNITDAEIDRALASFVPTTALKALASEIVLPAKGAERGNALVLARRLKQEIAKNGNFAEAARANSAGPTAARGGSLGWTRLSELPPEVATVLQNLAPGQVSEPVVLADKVVLYQLQELGEDKLGGPAATVVDYAQFLFPAGDTKEAARIRAAVDTCNDLYDLGKDLPAERLLRDTRPQAEIPADIAAALTLLDPGESTTTLSRGGWQVFLMLCSRGAPVALQPGRDQVRQQLTNQRLSQLAEIYIQELRAEAIIREP